MDMDMNMDMEMFNYQEVNNLPEHEKFICLSTKTFLLIDKLIGGFSNESDIQVLDLLSRGFYMICPMQAYEILECCDKEQSAFKIIDKKIIDKEDLFETYYTKVRFQDESFFTEVILEIIHDNYNTFFPYFSV